MDDSWVVDTAGARCDRELEQLGNVFKLTVNEAPDHMLGMNVSQPSPQTFQLSSKAYVRKLVSKYLTTPLTSHRTYATPADKGLHVAYEEALRRHQEGVRADPSLVKQYMSEVGALIYAAPSSRADVSHAVGILARALTFPTEDLRRYVQRVIAYLAQHEDLGLKYDGKQADADVLTAYSDSDWGVRQSTTGWVIKLAGAAVAWASRRQQSIAMSSTEAEIIAASDAALELVYLRGLLREMGIAQTKPTVLYVDNRGAVELSKDLKSCQRSRHVERRYLKVRELVFEGEIEVRWVDTKENLADLLSKGTIDAEQFNKLKGRMMYVDPGASCSSVRE